MSRSVVNCRLVGDKDLVKWVKALEPKIRTRILRPAVSAAARPVRMAAKQGAPKRHGWLKKSMGLKTVSGKGTAVAIVGPRTDTLGPSRDLYGRETISRPVKYAHLVEAGVKPHVIAFETKSGRKVVWMHPGTPGTRFLMRAFDATSSRATDILNARILKGIEKYA